MPTDWSVMGWVVVLLLLSGTAAVIGRFTARLFVRASGSRVSRRRA